MIYAIEAVGTEFVKIGFTGELTANGRISDMQVGCPYELRLIVSCAGTEATENELHWRLSKAHHRGEWFKRCPELEAVLNEMRLDSWRQFQAPILPSVHRRFGAVLNYSKECISGSVSLEPQRAAAIEPLPRRRARCSYEPFSLKEWRKERQDRRDAARSRGQNAATAKVEIPQSNQDRDSADSYVMPQQSCAKH